MSNDQSQVPSQSGAKQLCDQLTSILGYLAGLKDSASAASPEHYQEVATVAHDRLAGVLENFDVYISTIRQGADLPIFKV
jgi:hypothetical protein